MMKLAPTEAARSTPLRFVFRAFSRRARTGLISEPIAYVGSDGWGSFDDDNIVGTNFFMQTLELAVVLQDVGYGSKGELVGFDLYPTQRIRLPRCAARSSSGISS